MRGEQGFIQNLLTITRDLRNEIQDELWLPKSDSARLNRLLRAQADLESAVCNLLGTMD